MRDISEIYSTEEFQWLRLSTIKGVGPKTLRKIFSGLKDLDLPISQLFSLNKEVLVHRLGLSPQIVEKISADEGNGMKASGVYQDMKSCGIETLLLDDDNYPQKVKTFLEDDAPAILHIWGNRALLDGRIVWIANSRRTAAKSLEITYRFSELLSKHGLVIARGTSKFKDTDMISAYGAKESGSMVTILDRGLLHFLREAGLIGTPPPSNQLYISYAHPEDRWLARFDKPMNGLLAALADDIIAVDIKEQGITLQEILKASSRGKRTFVVRHETFDESNSGNKILIERGGVPISPKPDLESLREIVEMPKELIQSVDKVRQKDLGQFFTPLEVVSFMYDFLELIGDLPEDPKIIDPACGEGIFLKYALENGITIGENLYGIDIDPVVKRSWLELGIAQKAKLFIHNGLLDDEELGVIPDSFDIVIGNPPYGGTGLTELIDLVEESNKKPRKRKDKTIQLFQSKEAQPEKAEIPQESMGKRPLDEERRKQLIALANAIGGFYESWRRGETIEEGEEGLDEETPLFAGLETLKPGKRRVDKFIERLEKMKLLGKGKEQLHLHPGELRKLISFPIEILFAERFLRLAKPGGYIAIILPDGIFANSTTQYFRDWLLEEGQVLAVISLPRSAFTYMGANAKTSILFMRKYKKGEHFEDLKTEQVLLVSPLSDSLKGKELKEYFNDILGEMGMEASNSRSNPNHKRYKGGKGVRRISIRGNARFVKDPSKGASMITSVKSGNLICNRWDPEFWDPICSELTQALESCGYTVKTFEDLKAHVASGHRGKTDFKAKGAIYLDVKNITDTGLDLTEVKYVGESSLFNSLQRRVQYGDTLMNRSGIGSLGRICAVDTKRKACVGGHVYLIRIEGLKPHYVTIFLKSKYGEFQIQRYSSGVSGQIELDKNEIYKFKIPVLPLDLQEAIEKEYLKASSYHYKAMERKKILIARKDLSNKEAEKDDEYKRLISKARYILDKLIDQLEEVIEGKRIEITPIEVENNEA